MSDFPSIPATPEQIAEFSQISREDLIVLICELRLHEHQLAASVEEWRGMFYEAIAERDAARRAPTP